MDINHKALYNALRMNWVLDPTLEVEPWQVEDYRSMPLDGIFERLEEWKINLTKTSFLAYAETVETPEELTELLTAGSHEGAADRDSFQDQVYLLLFELWRRFLPEKSSLSLFCDELDYQIHLYDQEHHANTEAIQDTLANLEMILHEHTDRGADPKEAFQTINSACANDLENFLYDFISEQVDNGNSSYAAELLEGFDNFISEDNWFALLRARLLAAEDSMEAQALIQRLIKGCGSVSDLDFNLELLSFLVSFGEKPAFLEMVKKTIPILESEEDFQVLAALCVDFYRRLDLDAKERALQQLLDSRHLIDLSRPFDHHDPVAKELLTIVES
jgi:hypothetical protein